MVNGENQKNGSVIAVSDAPKPTSKIGTSSSRASSTKTKQALTQPKNKTAKQPANRNASEKHLQEKYAVEDAHRKMNQKEKRDLKKAIGGNKISLSKYLFIIKDN